MSKFSVVICCSFELKCIPNSVNFVAQDNLMSGHIVSSLPAFSPSQIILDPKDLCSLGVVDLDSSFSPDAFGLRAFDSKKPLTRMLPGSSPCELRLMLPDSKLGMDGWIS